MPGFYYWGPATNKEDALERLLGPHQYIAVDTETVNLEDRTCIGVGIATAPDEAYYFPTYRGPKKYINFTDCYAELVYTLERRDITKVFFNAPYDIGVLDDTHKIDTSPFDDLSVRVQVQGMHNDLARLVGTLMCIDHPEIKEILPKGKSMLDVDPQKTAWKCALDVMHTLALYYMMRCPEWSETTSLTWEDRIGQHYDVNPHMVECANIDIKLMPILRRMGKRGIALRPDKIEAQMFAICDQCRDYEKIFESYGVNIRSNQQVGMLLAERGNMLPFTKKYQLQVDEEALKACDDILAKMLVGIGPDYDPDRMIGYRELDKLRTTYIFPCIAQDRFYTHFRVDLATGRLASYDRNLQNIPPKVREIFAPDTGMWTWLDYSQIELRIFAYQSKSKVMLEAYAHKPERPGFPSTHPDADVHWLTQQTLFPGVPREHKSTRTKSKVFNFSNIFDATPETMARETELDIEAVSAYKDIWLDKYGVRQYIIEAGNLAWERGWAETEFGRRMAIPLDRGENHARKCGINYPDQGTAADIIKRAMLVCDAWSLDYPAQVHDELLFDGDVRDFLSNDGAVVLSHIHPDIYTPVELEHGIYWS